ncbi:hypothetical protein [Burkholderia sp. BDU5]|uniref:hypothetical protein n=1 Tax=Burkholderia sp. BDU5 TaxID=1385590 RepID=UPI000A6B6B93|nr:hypothetical protein [Burkholderia sp. BDU5]
MGSMRSGNWNVDILRDSCHFRQCDIAEVLRIKFFQILRRQAIHSNPVRRPRQGSRLVGGVRVPAVRRIVRSGIGASNRQRAALDAALFHPLSQVRRPIRRYSATHGHWRFPCL